MKLYTLDELIEIFKDIKAKGWVENARQGNVGGVGNTIEAFSQRKLYLLLTQI